MTSFLDDLIPFVLALVVLLGWLYLAATGNPAGTDLRDAVLLILGFYFGGKATRNGVTLSARNGSRRAGDAQL